MDIKKIAITVIVAILIPLFLALFIDAVYPEPDYQEYCRSKPYVEPINKQVNCSFDYGQEYQSCIEQEGNPELGYDENGCGYYTGCDFCNKDYNETREEYNRNVFFIFAIIGLIVIALGVYIKTDYIGAGLMFGGVITLFYSSIRYFSDLSKLLRALVILIDLIVIIYLGYKKIDKK